MESGITNNRSIRSSKQCREENTDNSARFSVNKSVLKVANNYHKSKIDGKPYETKVDTSSTSAARTKSTVARRSTNRDPENLLFDFEELDVNLRKKLNGKGHGDGNTTKLSSSTATIDNRVTKKAVSRKTRRDNGLVRRGHDSDTHVDGDVDSSVRIGGGADDDDDDERLRLSSWGLPEPVLRKYKENGVRRLFPWQAECLCTGRVLERGNLVYSAPTSAGKTMVAELLLLKSVVETKTKALFIFPFVSVAREKCLYLQKTFQEAGITVGGFYGGSSPAGGLASVDIAVCTIEKANNLVNRLLEEDGLNQLGCVVVDELHMVGDPHRGYLLELLVTKIRYVDSLAKTRRPSSLDGPPSSSAPPSSSSSSSSSIQIIGMSATLPNLNLLAVWLEADLFTSDFRPVPLLEMIKVGPDVFDQSGNKLRTLEPSCFKNDEDHVIHLCLETVAKDKCSVLVFCPTKNWCEKLADAIAREFYDIIIKSQNAGADANTDVCKLELSEKELSDVLELLRRSPSGLDPSIGKMIRCGVAYHHAGLTFEERDIIEGAFRAGTLKVLVATSTLSSGVNLPARRVIVRTPMFHGACIDALVYKQMIGRAGRKGVDVKGEGILICKTSERRQGFDLLNSQLPPIRSCLQFDPKMGLSSSMKRAILEIIVSKVASKMSEVELYARCTMLSASMKLEEQGRQNPPDAIADCIDYLLENEFIQIVKDPSSGQDSYVASHLGQAVVSSGLAPEEGLKIFVELQRSCRCFVLENDLHLVYLVTPVYMLDQFSIDWYHYMCIWEGLTSDLKRVGEVVGVQDRFISKAVGGKFVANGDRSVERMLSVHRRFYMSLALFELINESPLTSTCLKFKVNKGALQALQQSSSTFAGMVTTFVGRLGWRSMEALLNHFQSRLSFGVQQELVDLVRIPVITAKLARSFYAAGYINIASLALANVDAVVKLLRSSSSFLSKKKAEGESEWELEERMRTSRCIFVSGGGQGLTEREAAIEIINEARKMVADDLLKMGLKGVLPVGAGNGEEDDDSIGRPPLSKKAKLSIGNQIPTKLDNKKKVRNPKTTQSQASKSGKPRRSMNNSEAKVNTNESCLANTSILIPPKSFLESQKMIQGTSLIQSFTTTEPKTVRQIGRVEFFGLDSERSGNAENGDSASRSSLSANAMICANNVGISEDVNKTLNNFGNDTRMHFNNPSSVNHHASSTPKTAKKPFNPFFPSSPSGLMGQGVKGDPNPTRIDMEIDDSVELVFGNDSNNFDDSRFSDNTQFLLLASERLEDAALSNVEKNKTEGTWLPEAEGGSDRAVPPGKGSKHSENKSTLTDAQFHEDILAGSQLMEEFMQNTFDASGKYGSGKIASTPKTKPPTASTPRDIGSTSNGKLKKKTPRVIRDGTFSDIFVDAKLYCQVIPKEGKPKDKTINSEKKKKRQVQLDKSNKVEKSFRTAIVIDDDKVHSDPQERKQNCSLLFDARAPYSEEMFDDDDDDLVFEAPVINPGELTKAKGLPIDDNMTSCTKESEPKQIEPVNNMNSFTKLKIFDSNVIPKNSANVVPPADSVEIQGQSKVSNLAPASEVANNEPLFEENELFDSFFDQSCDFNIIPGLENQDPKVAKSDRGADPKNYLYNDELITPTAAAQLFDSLIFDEQDENDLPTPTIKTKRPETTDAKVYQTPGRQGAFNNGLCTPSSVAKKFKSFDDALTSQFDPDVEFVMKVFCDENDDTDGAKLKKWNKKAPKRHNSSNNSSNAMDSKPSTLSKIPQSPFDAGNNKIKAIGTSAGLRPFTNIRPITSESSSASTSKSIPKTSMIGQTTCHSNSNITISKNIINNINSKVNDNINIIKDISNNINESDLDDIVPPTPPGSPERSLSKAFCSGTTTPRRLLVGVVRPSPRASEKSELFNDWSESPSREVQKKKPGSRIVNSSRRLDMDGCDERGRSKDPLIPVPPMDTHQPMDNHPPSTNGLPPSLEAFTICDVASNRQLFETFLTEWRTKSYFSISLACDKSLPQDRPAQKSIGDKFRQKPPPKSDPGDSDPSSGGSFRLLDSDLRVTGLAISWTALDVYYVSFLSSVEGSDLDRSMAAPDLDPTIGVEERLEGVKQVLEAKTSSSNENILLVCYDAKNQFKALSGSCGFLPGGAMLDPKVACWLLDPGSREKTLHGLVATCCSHLLYLLEDVECTSGISSLGMTASEVTSARLRSCLEAVLVRQVMDSLKIQMMRRPLDNDGGRGDDDKLWKTFADTEMPVVMLLAKMELNGMGFDDKECESQKSLILQRISLLETNAYELAGHPFSLTSPDDISRVLFVELGLPPSGVPGVAPKTKSRGQSKTGRTSALPRFSSAKDILEKLVKLHPIAGVILEWRKLTTVLSKMVFPLQRAKVFCRGGLEMNRIHGVAETHTATGRVTMREPNLQNVPKDFSVAEEHAPEKGVPDDLINESMNYDFMCDDEDDDNANSNNPAFCVSMRSSFVPFRGGTMLAADYSQLELRIIAHMADDRKLIDLLNRGGDVFKAIAAQLRGVADHEVTNEQRQHAKQICYGMIYGIGAKSLGQQLGVDEEKAARFIESFKSTYSGIRRFLNDTVEGCRRKGFVETMFSRRRYLPSINSDKIHVKAHAERQSVNTTIQGSAADIVKSAMLEIDRRLATEFPPCRHPHRHLRANSMPRPTPSSSPRGAYLVLQLHDELIYEVNNSDLPAVARVVKRSMEGAVRLNVVLPVKVKVGPSWGKMADYEVPER